MSEKIQNGAIPLIEKLQHIANKKDGILTAIHEITEFDTKAHNAIKRKQLKDKAQILEDNTPTVDSKALKEDIEEKMKDDGMYRE